MARGWARVLCGEVGSGQWVPSPSRRNTEGEGQGKRSRQSQGASHDAKKSREGLVVCDEARSMQGPEKIKYLQSQGHVWMCYPDNNGETAKGLGD